jgi:hypothetical protein
MVSNCGVKWSLTLFCEAFLSEAWVGSGLALWEGGGEVGKERKSGSKQCGCR